MNKKKTFLYVSAAFVWLFIVMCTLMQDHSNHSISWYDIEEETKQIALEGGGSVFYGPLASGETEVILKYGENEVETIVPEKSEEIVCRSVFPAGAKHVGVSFEKENCLDTMVLFSSSEAYVFRHVVAMDSEKGRIAYLEPNETDSLTLMITTFDKITIKKIELKNFTRNFLLHPQIESAVFTASEFKLDTALGNLKVVLPSLI